MKKLSLVLVFSTLLPFSAFTKEQNEVQFLTIMGPYSTCLHYDALSEDSLSELPLTYERIFEIEGTEVLIPENFDGDIVRIKTTADLTCAAVMDSLQEEPQWCYCRSKKLDYHTLKGIYDSLNVTRNFIPVENWFANMTCTNCKATKKVGDFTYTYEFTPWVLTNKKTCELERKRTVTISSPSKPDITFSESFFDVDEDYKAGIMRSPGGGLIM